MNQVKWIKLIELTVINYFINSWFNRNEHNNSMNPVKWIKLNESS